jgi:hypothetical protein
MSQSTKRVKSCQIGVRLSPDESAEIRVRAECADVSPSAFLLAVYRHWRRTDNKISNVDLTGG